MPTASSAGHYESVTFEAGSYLLVLGVTADAFPDPMETRSSSINGTVSFAITQVPEPATWTTMVVGFGLVGTSFRIGQRQRRLPLPA